MSPEEKYEQLYREMSQLCEDQGWGDPSSFARSKEILTAIKLGHTLSVTLSGADGFNQSGDPVEYKSTTDEKVKGSYTGISKQDTWPEQDRYLIEEKIKKYSEHYYSRFIVGGIAEIWMLTGDQVYDILLPKLKKSYHSNAKKKDPRPSANVTYTEIMKHGTKIL
jgi:hypothetical protein